jgi:hypothetical protein
MSWDELFKTMSETYPNDENDPPIYDLVYGALLHVARHDGHPEEKLDAAHGLRESAWRSDCVARWLVLSIRISSKLSSHANEIPCSVRDNKRQCP